MSDILKMTLYGGPMDGEVIEIHRENLKIFPLLSCENDEGVEAVYGLDNSGQFVWLPNPDDPKVQRGGFVCDDDGNVIARVDSPEEALEALEKFENLKSHGWEDEREDLEDENEDEFD